MSDTTEPRDGVDLRDNKELVGESAERVEDLSRLMMSSSPDYIMLLDPAGTIRHINRTVPDLSVEQVIGTRIYDYLDETRAEEARASLSRTLATGEPDCFESKYLDADGRVSFFESRVAPVPRGGEVESLIVHSSDVTSYKRAVEELAASEARLRDSEERHRFLTANISDVIWTLGLDRRFLYVSPPIERLTGFAAEELKGRELGDILDDSSIECAAHTLAEELARDDRPGVEAGRSVTLDLRLRCKDGSVVWTESRMSFVRDGSGAPLRVLGVTRDISAWRQTQEALGRSERRLRQSQRLEAVGQLAGGVAHDFNNLLTVIQGNCDLLVRNFHESDPRSQRLEEIGKAARRAASLTRQLLAFARRQRLEPKVLLLNEVISETQAILERLLPEDIRISTALDPELGTVEADQGQLEQVLLNLTVNARDAMPRGGELRIATTNVDLRQGFDRYEPPVAPGRYVRLEVSDDGRGIPEQLQSKIFEPFFTTKDVGQGTGMGLATVYGIIKQSRGYIWAESNVDEGTTFEILLPRSTRTTTETRDPDTGPVAGGGSETLLLVEDDESVRDLAARVLRKSGYRVLEAATGRVAIEVCAGEGGRIDLVISDVVMPEMWGDELAGRLREAFPRLRFLFISGYGDRRHQHRSGDGGFLEKPFTSERLLDKVRAILDTADAGA